MVLDSDGEPVTRNGEQDRFQKGRRGDHLMVNFQCGLCHFRNLHWRDPNPRSPRDEWSLCCIRRASLDSFWSRASSTVRGNLARQREMMGIGQHQFDFHADDLIPPMGPRDLKDEVGMRVAMIMLAKSRKPGKNAATVQFSTARGIRTTYSNAWKSGLMDEGLAVMCKDLQKMHVTSCPTDGPWFGRFSEGMRARMGEQVNQDLGLTIEVMHAVQKKLEARWTLATTPDEHRRVAEDAMLFYGTFCWGLRGEELFLIAAGATRQVYPATLRHRTPHRMLGLIGCWDWWE